MAEDKHHWATKSASCDISFCAAEDCANTMCDRNTKGSLWPRRNKDWFFSFSDFQKRCLDYRKEESL